MPSDARTTEALRSLQGARQAFLSAVATAADAARALVRAQDSAAGDGASRAARELGPFAAGRVDLDRFSAVFAGAGALDRTALEVVKRAADILAQAIAAGDELFVARVPADGDLHATVEGALARAGQVFGAARAAELARTGAYLADTHAALLEIMHEYRKSKYTVPNYIFATASSLQHLSSDPLYRPALPRDARYSALKDVQAPPAARAR